MPKTDLASPTPWLQSRANSRRRRLQAARDRRRGLRRRGGVGVVLAVMTLSSGAAIAHERSAGGGASATVAAQLGSGVLKGGMRGQAVVELQRRLNVAADGVFGPLTLRAVKRFQRRNNLSADGVVGPQTRGALGISTAASPSAAAPATSPSPSAGASRASAVAAAGSKIGAPYRWGGTGPSSFDCSGLVQWAMRQAGVSLPRTSFAQYGVGRAVGRSEIRAGDLVFFNTAGPGPSDVGIATSSNTVISATSRGVTEHAIFDGYWGSHFVGARRV